MAVKNSEKPARRIHPLRYALWMLVALVVGLLVLVAVLGLGERRQALGSTPYGTPFALTDQNGAPFTEAALRDKPTAIFFGFTHCPEVCPTTMYELAGYQKALAAEGKELQVVFVSVDPARDKPALLKTYVGALSPTMVGLTGSQDAVNTMLSGWGIYAKKVGEGDDYTMDHTATVLLLKKGGGLFGTIAYGESPDVAREKLERLVSA